jgi:hypothetical protein
VPSVKLIVREVLSDRSNCTRASFKSPSI